MSPEPIDLLHMGTERTVAAYLVDTGDGPALFDCGPTTCVDALEAGLAQQGLRLDEIRHLVLTHVHLDHAGGAGTLVRMHPTLQVHVSAIGAKHLVDPRKLERSARSVFGESYDALWGELVPVPEQNVHVVAHRVLGLECFPTPGHASHHVSYLDGDGTLYAGDAAGVRIAPSRFVVPPTPPPEFDLESWQATLEEIEQRDPERLALTHWGVHEDVRRHLADLRLELYEWADTIRGGAGLEEFVEFVELELRDAGESMGHYDLANALRWSYQGLKQWADRL